MKFLGMFSKWGDGRSSGYEDLFNTPFTQNAMLKLIGRINGQSAYSQQLTAVNATLQMWVADFQGSIADLYLVVNAQPAATETYTFDVQRAPQGGSAYASILTGTFTLTAANWVNDQISLYSLIAAASFGFNIGDQFQVVRSAITNQTNLAANRLTMEPSTKRWK